VSLLEIRNVTKTFGDNQAVDDVTLTIRKGEFSADRVERRTKRRW
jgi:ABC-type Fe3+/spermidine/putrescine transport system ATPase subunit